MFQRSFSHTFILFAVFHSSFPQRRIRDGLEVMSNKRYVVYLLRASSAPNKYDAWLCGGAILSKDYVVTSAACVQDVRHLYVVPGYRKYVSDQEIDKDACVKEKKKKVVLICVPRNYFLDYNKTEVWSRMDIAVIKVESPFDFEDASYEKVCSYIPGPIEFNTEDNFPKPGDDVVVFGWGHKRYFRKDHESLDMNQAALQYASTKILDEETCIKYYRRNKELMNIIEKSMLCTLHAGNLNDLGHLNTRSRNVALGCISEAARTRGESGRLCNSEIQVNLPPIKKKIIAIVTKPSTTTISTTSRRSTIDNTSSSTTTVSYTKTSTPSSEDSKSDNETDEESSDGEVAVARRQLGNNTRRQDEAPAADETVVSSAAGAEEGASAEKETTVTEEVLPEEEPTVAPPEEDLTVTEVQSTAGAEEGASAEKEATVIEEILPEEETTAAPSEEGTTVTEEVLPEEETTVAPPEEEITVTEVVLPEEETTVTDEAPVTKEVPAGGETLATQEGAEKTPAADNPPAPDNSISTNNMTQPDNPPAPDDTKTTTPINNDTTEPEIEVDYTPGICQNDHGGPLVAWRGSQELLVAVATLYRVDRKMECLGPYLYTRTSCNRAFINCIVNQEAPEDARRSCDNPEEIGFTIQRRHISWIGHRDGPADNERIVMRHQVPISAYYQPRHPRSLT